MVMEKLEEYRGWNVLGNGSSKWYYSGTSGHDL